MKSMTNVSVPLSDKEATPTFGWLMVDKKPIQALKKLAISHPIAMGCLMHFVENMSRSNAYMASQKNIAEQLGVSTVAVKKAVAVLEDSRFVQIVKIGTSNAYVVNTRVAWQGRRGSRFAHFHADIIAYENEQPKGKDLDNKDPLIQIPTTEPGERLLVMNTKIDPPDQQEMELP
jgi:DNA-binding transcriptional regulator YhcF (GntR family)